jgi:hypothetical protein
MHRARSRTIFLVVSMTTSSLFFCWARGCAALEPDQLVVPPLFIVWGALLLETTCAQVQGRLTSQMRQSRPREKRHQGGFEGGWKESC